MDKRSIEGSLKRLPGWRYLPARRVLVREYVMPGFAEAVTKINQIARLAQKMGHHPDLSLTRYKRLKITLTTHSAGGVTAKDFALAREIEK